MHTQKHTPYRSTQFPLPETRGGLKPSHNLTFTLRQIHNLYGNADVRESVHKVCIVMKKKNTNAFY